MQKLQKRLCRNGFTQTGKKWPKLAHRLQLFIASRDSWPTVRADLIYLRRRKYGSPRRMVQQKEMEEIRLSAIGVIGLLLAIACLIILSYKGVNAFIASLIASLVVVVTNLLPFWETFSGAYATGLKNFVGNYFLLFGLAAAYGEFLKVTGAAESVAKVLFKIFGVKWAPLGALLITLLMAMGGVSAFVIVFAVYPVAAPLFRKANITKNLLPGIVLCASVTLCLCLPGNPTSTNALLARPEYGLGVDAFSAPVMGIIACIVGTVLAGIYVTWQARRQTALGVGYVVSGTDALDDDEEKNLPPFWASIIPLLIVVFVMILLKNVMSATNSILTSLCIAIVACVVLNPKVFFGTHKKHGVLKTFTTGMWSSCTSALLLTGGVMGFAGVVQAAPGFQYFVDFANGLTTAFNPYVSASVAVNVVAGITGTALGGLQIFADTMLPNYINLGINPEAFHRLMTIACCGLDTLPHCSTFILMCSVCGVTAKDSYKHVFPLTVVMPILLTVLCILMISVGII